MPTKATNRQLRCKAFNVQGNGGIKTILVNPIYGGLVKAPGHYDEPEKICKAIHESIIGESTWWRVQSLFNTKQPAKKLLYNDDFPLRRLIKPADSVLKKYEAALPLLTETRR